MNKYIDVKLLYNQVAEKEELARQRVIDTPSRLPNGDVNPYATRYATQLDERTTFKFMLMDAPTADVVEVVRCKDCIHYMPYDWMFSEVRKSENINDYPKNEIGCEWIDHHINPEGYCSYGERKDG